MTQIVRNQWLFYPLLALLLAAGGCGGAGGEGESEGLADDYTPPGAQTEEGLALEETVPPFRLGTKMPLYRLDLLRRGEALELRSLARVEAEVVPAPAFSPDYIAVGHSGPDEVSVAPFAFPLEAHRTLLVDGARVHEGIQVEAPSTVIYLEHDFEGGDIEVISREGDLVLSVTKQDVLEKELQAAPQGKDSLRQKSQPIETDQLAFRYSHIRFLTSGEDALLDPALLGTGSIIAPSPAMNDVLADGLAKVPSALLGSVSSIAVVKWPSTDPNAADVLGMAYGAQLVVNADKFMDRDEMVLTMVHEIAHNFTFLVNATAGKSFSPSDWPPHVVDAASALLAKFQLAAGLDSVFNDLQSSGQSAGTAAPYTGPGTGWYSLSLPDARAGGFASPYGSVNPWEDIAEYVGSVQAPTSTTPGICPVFVGVSEISSAVAIPFAKLVFLRALGALGEREFSSCLGTARVQYSQGINFDSISFTGDPKAGFLTLDDGSPGFGILADGPNTYKMLLEFPLARSGASPLGLHRFNSVWAWNFGASGGLGRVLVSHEEPLRARLSEGGMVLVTEASSDRVAGVVLGLVLQNAAGLNTDSFPFGTFEVR